MGPADRRRHPPGVDLEFYELYAIIDIFSRYVPGWLVVPAESAELAEAFIADTIARNGAARRSLHADRGSSMTPKAVAQLLVDLGVARSRNRPHVSNDNPYGEGNFKTLKALPRAPRALRLHPRRRCFLRGVLHPGSTSRRRRHKYRRRDEELSQQA